MTANLPELEDIAANGINGATGELLLPPLTDQEAAGRAAFESLDELASLQKVGRGVNQPHLGALFGIDLLNIREAGWAVVFHTAEDPAVKAALQPLIEHRRNQIGDDTVVKVLEYRDGETVPQWLARHGIAQGDIDPSKVPFYVLLAGSPVRIPFLFGHLLDAVYGVGRLSFDTPAEYAAYANSVIAYETDSSVPTTRDVHFFGPRHRSDKPTNLSANWLVKPLATGDATQPSVLDRLAKSKFKLHYSGQYLPPEASSKQALHDVFCPAGTQAAALLFTASHGLGWPLGDARQPTAQGALLCQDFPGAGFGPVRPEHYFAATDLPADAHVHGLVCFHFACYGAGTPAEDRFTHKEGEAPCKIAPEPFFSPLPRALLTHRNGGALGVIGHVERAWPTSIVTAGAGAQLVPFINALSNILCSIPLGYALKDFNERYAMLSTTLSAMLEQKSFGLSVPDTDLAAAWVARNDAEAYVLFGDPGVSIRKGLAA